MSTPFANTMRSLETDTTHTQLIGLGVIAVLLAIWLTWGFIGQVTVYAAADQAIFTSSTTLVAHFPASTIGHIQPGQIAQLRLDSYPWQQYGTIPATVTMPPQTTLGGQLEVHLKINSDSTNTLPLQQGMTTTAEIIVNQLTPTNLLLQATGRQSQQ